MTQPRIDICTNRRSSCAKNAGPANFLTDFILKCRALFRTKTNQIGFARLSARTSAVTMKLLSTGESNCNEPCARFRLSESVTPTTIRRYAMPSMRCSPFTANSPDDYGILSDTLNQALLTASDCSQTTSASEAFATMASGKRFEIPVPDVHRPLHVLSTGQ